MLERVRYEDLKQQFVRDISGDRATYVFVELLVDGYEWQTDTNDGELDLCCCDAGVWKVSNHLVDIIVRLPF